MKAFNTLKLTCQNSRYGTVATEHISSNALTTSLDDTRYAGLPICPRLASTALRRGVIPAGKPFMVTREGAITGAWDSATIWGQSARDIRLIAYIDFDDYYDTTFILGERISDRDWRKLSSTGRELYNWRCDHGRAIRGALRMAKLAPINWAKVAYNVPTTIAEIRLTDDVGVYVGEQIGASLRIATY